MTHCYDCKEFGERLGHSFSICILDLSSKLHSLNKQKSARQQSTGVISLNISMFLMSKNPTILFLSVINIASTIFLR